ncbi:MAG: glycosyl hydrolase 108 family protein [Bacteroidota bacterium]
MAVFEKAIGHVKKWEGGLANHPNDRGGLTNFGITIGTFKRYAQPVLGIQPTETNLRNLTWNQAKWIYLQVFWKGMRGDQINDQDIANILFDAYVNKPGNAIRLMQESLNRVGQKVVVDNLIGPQTIAAINRADPKRLFNEYKRARANYYKARAANIPDQQVFLDGWLARINDFDSFPNTAVTGVAVGAGLLIAGVWWHQSRQAA